MPGIKVLNTERIFIIILLALIIVFFIILSRSNAIPHQISYNLFRYLTGQETKLTTANYEILETNHYVIKYLTADESYIEMIGEAAEEAYGSVTNQLGREPVQKTTVVVYPDSQSLAKSFGWDKDQKALGVYWGGTIRILSPREWLSNEDIKANFIKQGPMVHELVHLMVDDMTRGNYNRWWTEGIAQYYEKKITGFEFSKPFNNGQKIKYYRFNKLDKNFDNLNQPVAYWQSLKVVEYIVDQYGENSLFEIMDYLEKGNSVNQSIAQALGINFAIFEANFISNIENV